LTTDDPGSTDTGVTAGVVDVADEEDGDAAGDACELVRGLGERDTHTATTLASTNVVAMSTAILCHTGAGTACFGT
jgi:hypothetical protein